LKDDGRRRTSQAYRPKVEALEALRLLDAGLVPSLAPLVAEQAVAAQPVSIEPGLAHEAAWDAALEQTRLADLLGRPSELDPQAILSGLDQLNRYLARCWARAGISSQAFEDCTQTVYEVLLEQHGREGFDQLAGDIGRNGVSKVLNWDAPDGPDFFRAVDMVKKRAQRTRSFQSLDDHHADLTDTAGGDGASADWRGALDEAIDRALSDREAALIRDTLQGKTPAEIAQQWGVAPKTISNEKSRAIQKLREVLVADLAA
jgi:RNA polymerase sigma factor (sigma-70 family)